MSSNGSIAAAPLSSSPNRTRARCCVSPIMLTCWRTATLPPKAKAALFWPTIAFNVPISELFIHENHRRAFALGYRARLSAANPRRAGAAKGDLELAGQISFRLRDGAVFPRQQRADHPRFRLRQISADRGDACAA